jgi:hypothetical protein
VWCDDVCCCRVLEEKKTVSIYIIFVNLTMRISHRKLHESVHNSRSVKWNSRFLLLSAVQVFGSAISFFGASDHKNPYIWLISQTVPIIISLKSHKLYSLALAFAVVIAVLSQILSGYLRLRKCKEDGTDDCFSKQQVVIGGVIYIISAIISILLNK